MWFAKPNTESPENTPDRRPTNRPKGLHFSRSLFTHLEPRSSDATTASVHMLKRNAEHPSLSGSGDCICRNIPLSQDRDTEHNIHDSLKGYYTRCPVHSAKQVLTQVCTNTPPWTSGVPLESSLRNQNEHIADLFGSSTHKV